MFQNGTRRNVWAIISIASPRLGYWLFHLATVVLKQHRVKIKLGEFNPEVHHSMLLVQVSFI